MCTFLQDGEQDFDVREIMQDISKKVPWESDGLAADCVPGMSSGWRSDSDVVYS